MCEPENITGPIYINTGVSGNTDGLNCNQYNCIINERLNRITSDISNNIIGPAIGQPMRPNNFVNNNVDTSSLKFAGGRFSTGFPSKCMNCPINSNIDISLQERTCNNINNIEKIRELLLNKKGYMFANSNNKNVISGPIHWRSSNKVVTVLQFGGTSGSGLTKNQQLSNMGKGLTATGKPSRKFGVQSYNGIKLYSNSNIFNYTNPVISTTNNSVGPQNGYIQACNNN